MTPARREAARDLLRDVGLGDRLDYLPRKLSGGQQQRVAIARALSLAPPLVLADEPTGNLDTHSADEIFALMRRFNRERGVAFLIVTHDPRLAHRCDRIVDLVDGRIAGSGPIAVMAGPAGRSIGQRRAPRASRFRRPGAGRPARTRADADGIARSALEEAAQHPGVLLVDLHALGQQIGRRLVVGLVDHREDRARGAHDRFVALDQQPDHLLGLRLPGVSVIDASFPNSA